MERDRLRHDHGLEQVALELVHHEHHADDAERDRPAARHERDEGGERAHEDRADVGHEAPEEDEHGEREGERHAEQREPEPDGDGVDERDDRRAAYVAAEDLHRGLADAVGALAILAFESLREEAPHRVAVLEEEEEEDDDEHGAGEDVDDRGHPGDRAHAESRGHHHLGRVIADGVPIHLGQGPGQVGGEAPQLVVARRGRARELLPLGPDREDYHGDEAPEHEERHEERHPRGEERGEPEAAEPRDERCGRRGDEERDEERDHHHAHLDQRERRDDDDGEDRQDLDAPDRPAPEPITEHRSDGIVIPLTLFHRPHDSKPRDRSHGVFPNPPV